MELTITERAKSVIRDFVSRSDGELKALRITSHPGGIAGTRFELSLVPDLDHDENDIRVDMGDFTVLMSRDGANRLEGATVDFVERVNESGFEVRPVRKTPTFSGPPTGELAEKVKEILETQVNPAVASHGGEIILVDVQGTDIYIEMGGGCQGCALSRMTLKQGVERMVRQAVPEITGVFDVTDHTSGESPFY
jgi:Fe/S biogenesis protein NfuA